MISAQTAVPYTSDAESAGTTELAYLPIQMIAPVLEIEGEIHKGECPITVFRYAVAGGWIVGTLFHGTPTFAQSFVSDPDYIWTATFPDNKTQPTPQP